MLRRHPEMATGYPTEGKRLILAGPVDRIDVGEFRTRIEADR